MSCVKKSKKKCLLRFGFCVPCMQCSCPLPVTCLLSNELHYLGLFLQMITDILYLCYSFEFYGLCYKTVRLCNMFKKKKVIIQPCISTYSYVYCCGMPMK